ncbi:ankyrin repeat domain-containing protein 61-like [Antedon mediterranea]|uniref:ankyrin repeat domain-containing protein 61-like n=1 Tax=Antedon mediterranea TaxID=105859 RepID=UPI003AF5E0BC
MISEDEEEEEIENDSVVFDNHQLCYVRLYRPNPRKLTPREYICKCVREYNVETCRAAINSCVNFKDLFSGEDSSKDPSLLPLHIVCNQIQPYAELAIAQLLLASGLDPNIQDNLGRTAIHGLIRRLYCESVNDHSTVGNVTLTRGFTLMTLIIEFGGNLNTQDYDGRSPVHLCAFYSIMRLIPAITPFLRTKIDLETSDIFGNTPIHVAADYCHFGVLQELVSLGANPALVNDNSETALHLATKNFMNRGIECVRFLISSCKLDVNQRDKKHGSTPLHIACSQSRNRDRVIRMLIDHGADPNIKDDIGRTSLSLYLHNYGSIKMEYLNKRDILANFYGITDLSNFIDNLHGLNSLLNATRQVKADDLPSELNEMLTNNVSTNPLIIKEITHRSKNPSTLQFICKCCIRKSVKPTNITRSMLTSLELTNPAIDFIMKPRRKKTLAVEYVSRKTDLPSPFFLWNIQGCYKICEFTCNPD